MFQVLEKILKQSMLWVSGDQTETQPVLTPEGLMWHNTFTARRGEGVLGPEPLPKQAEFTIIPSQPTLTITSQPREQEYTDDVFKWHQLCWL